MIGINIKSSLLFESSKKYKLSSIISGDNLIYSLTDKSTNKIVAVKELPNLKENFFFDETYLLSLFEKNNLLNENIDEISIGILNPDFSIVPKNTYDKEIKKELFNSVSIKQHLKDYKIFKNDITTLQSYNLFVVPRQLKRFLNEHFDSLNFYHANEIFFKKYKFIDSYNNLLLANLNEHYLQTAVYKDDKLQQTNVYSIKSKEDILYHIMANLTNHAIPINNAEVILAGRLDKESAIFNLLYEHIKNVKFIENISRMSFSNVFLGKPKYLFFDIYALSKCE